jgi:hypothetical protein
MKSTFKNDANWEDRTQAYRNWWIVFFGELTKHGMTPLQQSSVDVFFSNGKTDKKTTIAAGVLLHGEQVLCQPLTAYRKAIHISFDELRSDEAYALIEFSLQKPVLEEYDRSKIDNDDAYQKWEKYQYSIRDKVFAFICGDIEKDVSVKRTHIKGNIIAFRGMIRIPFGGNYIDPLGNEPTPQSEAKKLSATLSNLILQVNENNKAFKVYADKIKQQLFNP